MQDRLVEHVMGILDSSQQAEMEEALRRDPELRRRADRLQQALAPLATDREEEDAPPGLVARTVARVAEHICAESDLPHAPTTIADRGTESDRPRRLRADVIVAASLLLAVVGLAAPYVLRTQTAAHLAECQNNLRQLHVALSSYRDQHGRFPDVAVKPPFVAAGMVLPLLRDAGVLPAEATLRCPNAVSADDRLEMVGAAELRNMSPDEFEAHAARLSPYYAYSLGYRDEAGNLHSPAESPDVPRSLTPLMADSPPAYGIAGNSRNHEGKGQNVLFADGHVRFATLRTVGYGGDDIFLNRDRKVAAGLGAQDAVLGWSAAQP